MADTEISLGGTRGPRGPRGHDGHDGAPGSVGSTGPTGSTGATGPASTPPLIACANIAADGGIVGDGAEGFSSVTKTGTGAYTLVLSSVAAADADAAIPGVTSSTFGAQVFVSATVGTVGPQAAVLVRTFGLTGDPVDSSFYITVARNF